MEAIGFTDPNRIFIQSFEFQNLIELQGMLDESLGDIPLVQLYGNTTEDASPDEGFSVPYDIRYNLKQGNDLVAIYGQEFLDAVENGLSEDTTYRDLDSAEMLQVISDLYLGDDESATIQLDDDSVYVPYLLANKVRFFTSFAEANPDGIDHVFTEENTFSFEDLLGGGDGDFDDYVISFDVA